MRLKTKDDYNQYVTFDKLITDPVTNLLSIYNAMQEDHKKCTQEYLTVSFGSEIAKCRFKEDLDEYGREISRFKKGIEQIEYKDFVESNYEAVCKNGFEGTIDDFRNVLFDYWIELVYNNRKQDAMELENAFQKIRNTMHKGQYISAARFLYLNANSFNGIYRVNRQGQYNVPYGKKEKTVNYERLKEISVKLQNVNIQCQDFFDIRDNIQERDLVFLDPPYTVSNNKNDYFIQYNQKLFSLDDQRRLATLIEYIVNHNAWFILTNAHNKTIHNIFSGIAGTREIERERKSLIGGRAAFRGNVQEYIFTNIPERN